MMDRESRDRNRVPTTSGISMIHEIYTKNSALKMIKILNICKIVINKRDSTLEEYKGVSAFQDTLKSLPFIVFG